MSLLIKELETQTCTLIYRDGYEDRCLVMAVDKDWLKISTANRICVTLIRLIRLENIRSIKLANKSY